MAPVENIEHLEIEHLEVGFDIPARPGMKEADIQTPCLILDLDALENNIRKMGGLYQGPWHAPSSAWQDAQVG